MSRVYGYDFDGVLSEAPPPREKKWGHMNGDERRMALENAVLWYRIAKPLFRPPVANFHVITARKETPAVRAASEAWLAAQFPSGEVLSLTLLTTSRTIERVSAYKAETVLALGITDFHEDNPAVVRAMRKILKARCRVWLVSPTGELSL